MLNKQNYLFSKFAGQPTRDAQELNEFVKFLHGILDDTAVFTCDLETAIMLAQMERGLKQSSKRVQDTQAYLLVVLELFFQVNNGKIRLELNAQKAEFIDFVLESWQEIEKEQQPGWTAKFNTSTAVFACFNQLLAGVDKLQYVERIQKELAQSRGEVLPDFADTGDNELRVVKPLVVENNFLYFQKHYELYCDLLERLDKFETEISTSILTDNTFEQELKNILGKINTQRKMENPDQDKIKLNEGQKDALQNSLKARLSVITGGPGTGKTFITKMLLPLFQKLYKLDNTAKAAANKNLEEIVALAAPTGKAANRMDEMLNEAVKDNLISAGLRSQTIHRLLGFSQKGNFFHHHRNNPLDYKVLIVDETSMVDAFLLNNILEAGANIEHLVLIGDANQLPPIKTDSVFYDLVEKIKKEKARLPGFALTVLEESYRQDMSDIGGRNVFNVAKRIKDVDKEITMPVVKDSDTNQMTLKGIGESKEEKENIYLAESFIHREDAPNSDKPEQYIQERSQIERIKFEGVELFADHSKLVGLIGNWWNRFWAKPLEELAALPLEFLPAQDKQLDDGEKLRKLSHEKEVKKLFNQITGYSVLTVTNSHSTGRKKLNQLMQKYYQDFLQSKINSGNHQIQLNYTNRKYLHGEPVIVKRNDYYKKIFNGDIGMVLEVRETASDPADSSSDLYNTGEGEVKTKRIVIFNRGNKLMIFDLNRVKDNLDLAWAITIHKSQGSEFNNIITVLPSKETPLLSRQLLYTALTRSRKSTLIISSPQILGQTIKSNQLTKNQLL